MFILGASIRVRAPYRTRQSLILLHRCYAHYIPLTIVVLFVHHDTTPLCCVHVIVLPNRCAYYYAHSSNVRPVFPVHILYFLQCLVYFGITLVTESFVAFSTIIARSYRAWQQTLCVSYYNIIYVLFLPLLLSKNTECLQAHAQNWQKSLLLCVVFITSLGCSSLSITRHKIYTAFRGVYVL